MSCVVLLDTSWYFWTVHFMANRMTPKWPRSDRYFDSYAHSTGVLPKRPFLVDLLEYGSENDPYLRVEWSKIDATNAVVFEKDCFTIAVLQFSTKSLRVSAQCLMFGKTGSQSLEKRASINKITASLVHLTSMRTIVAGHPGKVECIFEELQ